MKPSFLLAALVATVTTFALPTQSAELRFLCATAMQAAMNDLLPKFQQASGHAVVMECSNVNVNAAKVEKGERFDLVTLAPEQLEQMTQSGKLVRGKGGLLAKAGTGVAVKRGAEKPPLTTLEEFRTSLLKSRGIALNSPQDGGPSGINALALFDRLGIAEELRPKLKFTRNSRETTRALVNGEVDLGISQVGQILADPEIDFAGPFPANAQKYTELMAAIPVGSERHAVADELLLFLRSPDAKRTLAASGLETE